MYKSNYTSSNGMFPCDATFSADFNEQLNNSSFNQSVWYVYDPHFVTSSGVYSYNYLDETNYSPVSYEQHYFADNYLPVYYYHSFYYDFYEYPVTTYLVPVFYYPGPVTYTATFHHPDVPYEYDDACDISYVNNCGSTTLENRDSTLNNYDNQDTYPDECGSFEVYYREDEERLNQAACNEDDEKEENVENDKNYDHHVEKIYDDFRLNKTTFQEEGKWNLSGLNEFLSHIDLTESLRKCPCYKCEAKEEALKAAQDTAEAVDNETDDDEYLEYLCNINYGITLEEFRALEERTSEYWPGNDKGTSKGDVQMDDKITSKRDFSVEDKETSKGYLNVEDKMPSKVEFTVGDKIISEDHGENYSPRVPSKRSFEREKRTEYSEEPDKKSDEKLKKRKKRRFQSVRKWFSKTFCGCCRTKDPP